MKKELFNELVQSVNQAVLIENGRAKPSRTLVVKNVNDIQTAHSEDAVRKLARGKKMQLMQIRPFQLADEAAIISLWQQCELVRPVNDPRKDIRRKLAVRPDLFLVGVLDDKIVASVMAGYDGHRGWLNYLAVAPEHQRCGYGRALVNEIERLLRTEGCAKINLQVRTTNQRVIEFYRRIGFVADDVVSMGKRSEQDEPPN